MFTLVKVRYRQAMHEFAKMGPFYVVFVFVMAFLLYGTVLERIEYRKHPVYVVALFGLLAVNMQWTRVDGRFVRRKLDDPVGNMFWEHFLLLHTLAVPLLFTSNALYYLCFAPISALVLILKTKEPSTSTLTMGWLSRVLPWQAYDWLDGLRARFKELVFVYLATLLFSWVPYVPFVGMLYIFSVVLTFTLQCEPLCLMVQGHKGAEDMFWAKYLIYFKVFIIIQLPLAFINLALQIEQWYLWLPWLAFQAMILFYAIALKYANYANGRYLGGNFIPLMVSLVSLLLPFVLPVLLFVGIRNYKKMIFLHDRYWND